MNKRAARFRNKGLLLFDIMKEMLPSRGKGTHVLHPGTKQPKPKPAATPQSMPASTPATSASPPATPTREALSLMPPPPTFQMPAAVTSRDNPIGTPAMQSAPTDISGPPSTPSSFLAPSGHGTDSSSVLTSASGKTNSAIYHYRLLYTTICDLCCIKCNNSIMASIALPPYL